MTSYESIITQQSELVEEIKSISSNFKKDGASRKLNEEYHDERLNRLEQSWKKFEFNHDRICLLKQEQTGEYFQKGVKSKLENIYKETKEMITKSKRSLEKIIQLEESKLRAELERKRIARETLMDPGQSTSTSQTNMPMGEEPNSDGESYETSLDAKTVELLNEQKSHVKAFQRAICNLNIDNITEKWQLEDKLRTITIRWENFDKLYWKLDNIIKDNNSYDQQYNKLENMYETAKTLINTKIWEQNHQEKAAPKIEIPTFNGNYSHWTTFKDLFTETVHYNAFISKAQKMQHLKAKLKGEAERLVQHLTISADNYDTCWSILQQRYDNVRLLFTYHANELLNQPTIQQATAFQIKRLHDSILENINAITNLHIDTTNWDPLLVHILIQKLDVDTKQSYIESLKNPREVPRMEDFLTFLENKFMALESTNTKSSRNIPEKQNNNKNMFHKKLQLDRDLNGNKQLNSNGNRQFAPKAFYNNVTIRCPQCSQQHGLYSCKVFLDMTSNERLLTAKKLGVCKNCLFSHNGNNCTSTQRCKQCNQSHNTLLHEAVSNESGKVNKSNRISSHLWNEDQNEVLLATALIEVQTSFGRYITLRALLDQGSQVSLITEDAAQRLQLKRNKLNAVVTGVGAAPTNRCKGVVRLPCKAVNANYEFTTEALVMNTITSKLPNKNIDRTTLESLDHIQLADPNFHVPQNIDILLGADIYSEILLEGLIKSKNSTITAQQTHLGWIIFGKHKMFQCHVIINNLEEIEKFWEQEEISENKTNSNQQKQEADFCETLYTQTTERLADGRYQVRLPLKPEIGEKLGKSKPQAVAQLKQLERKMDANPEFAQNYTEFMAEYKHLGHMVKAENSNNTARLQYFLPHHGIVRQNAITTKLRVVFNASAKTSTKSSLNDLMESGPNLQADLQGVLLQWRQHQYVLTADIEKMYRYLAMHPDDQTLQKIVWRESSQQPIEEYQLCTVTYGTKAAPFLALRTLKQLAEDEGGNFPIAKPILLNNFFMDDAMFGSHTIEDAKQKRDQLMQLLSCGGFNLRKWASNEPQLVEDLPKKMRNPLNFNFTDTDSSKTLGLGWNPKNDEFEFSPVLQHKETKTITKRQILSEVSSLFDPLGWLAPITVKSKIIFQQVWKNSLEWDEAVPEHIKKEWMPLRAELTTMEQFKIKRWLGCTSELDKETELHAFCDASEKAYACVVYSTVRNSDGTNRVNIVAAKTKVTPVRKQQSLPRLELCGAQLLAKLVNKIKQSLNRPDIKVTAWTDSMVVLGWLKGDENRWNRYVATRVRSTKEVIPAQDWQYVKSKNNPADCASRGLLPTQLSKHTLWWQGPEWLQNNKMPEKINLQEIPTCEEAKVHTVTVQDKEPNIITKTLNNCNSIAKAVRVIMWVSRFINKARAQRVAAKHFTLADMKAARSKIIHRVQQDHFEDEIRAIKTNNTVNKNSKIWKLNPFVDESDLLRVGGRLKHSNLTENAKHPLIIPKESRLTQLLINEAHKTTLHGGARLTLATLRQRYWIIGGTTTVKNTLKKCVTCSRYKTTREEQLMGDLPRPRVTPSPPFYHTGVDFTGWVDIKLNKGRGVRTSKGYVAVFVCLATKAVHLELVTDLTTQTFILALKRMAARRGCPAHLYSDNGTNFVGANRELQRHLQTHKTFNNNFFWQTLAEQEIQWHFNAPSWPSAGGIWEAAVKSMKHHLKRVLGEQKLTYEEFQTLLTQIEACMNSRPLCPLTEDADDAEHCLTPGHFLIGRPIISIPQENLQNSKIGPRRRWQLTEKMFQGFWKQWSLEYLHELQQRAKWCNKTRNIQKGDIVLIKEDNLTPMKWPLGRVMEVYPGRDNLVRVVTVKTQDSVYKRPITKLVLLPVTNSDENAGSTAPNSSNINKADDTLTDTQQNRPSGQHGRKTTRSSLLCIFIMLLTLFHPSRPTEYSQMKSFTQSEDLVNIAPFKDNKLVYFDNMGKLQNIHDTWKIVTYYNMTSYWIGLESVQRLVAHVEGRCELFRYRTICDSVTAELKQEVEDLKHNNNLLKTQHGALPRRVIRGLLNGVGYLANTLFGVLDDSFAQKYSSDIEAVNNNNLHLLALIKNQTSIVEAHNNILKRNEDVMKKQFQLIQEHLNTTEQFVRNMNERITQEDNMNYFNMMAMAASMFINKLQYVQQTLLDTATNIHHGQVDTRLFSQEQLKKELNIISGQLPAHLHLPVDNTHDQLSSIYKLLTVKTRVVEKYFIIEISLPLTSEVKFNLYKTIPIPIKKQNTTLTLRMESEYIAVNLRKDIYMPLTDKDISACSKIDTYNFICAINRPTYNMHSNQSPCEISILTNSSTSKCIYEREQCADKWIPLQSPNAWMYFCCDECLPRVICDEHMASRSLKMAGIINTKQGCIIKHGETTIHTQQYFQNDVKINPQIQVPYSDLWDLNSIQTNQAIAPPKIRITTDFNTDDLSELQNNIETLKQQSVLPNTVSIHDVHQYTVSYITLGIVVTILAAAGCKYLHWQRRRNTLVIQQRSAPRVTHLETKDRDSGPVIEMTSRPVARATHRIQQEQQLAYALPRTSVRPKFDI